MSFPFIAAVVEAPLIGVRKRWPRVMHAVVVESVTEGWKRGTFSSACGLVGLRLEGVEIEGVLYGVPWPPRLKGTPSNRERCRNCWVATGKPRPRVEWKKP